MRDVSRIEAAAVQPGRGEVLHRLGLEPADVATPRLEDLLVRSAALFARVAAPAAVFEWVTREDFATIYEGDGENAPASPLDEIFPRADALALFAVTLGSAIDQAIRDLFDRGDSALGYVLDVSASYAADRLADLTAERFLASLRRSVSGGIRRVLPYSPGYCGWHVSGQRALFESLRPDDIKVALTASCLMDPLKSVSGVFVAGRGTVHRFRPTYPFCDACTTQQCRVRLATVK